MIRNNQIFYIIIFLLFLVVSFMFISPISQKARSAFHSSQLEKITVTSENAERTDYVDSNGQLTIASNLGYAAVIVTKSENGELERYFDDKGEPISSSNGSYAVLKEFDDRENKTRITYLNLSGEPMIMANGYASEVREYSEKGQELSVRYYDTEGNPILTSGYGYGKINEYNENGKISRITYIDASGAPMMTGLGYASITRNYYTSDGPENGRIESEFYFDETGKPVCLSLGQYGVHKEYYEYGRESVLTYLDAAGKPITTNKGYTTVVRTYYADRSVETEMYYDMEGRVISLLEGQYGIKNINNQKVYLNRNGEEIFNLKNLLYNHSWVAIIGAIIIITVSSMTGKRWNIFFLVMYICAICYLTLMFRESNVLSSPRFLWYYKKIFTDSEARADIIKNIWLFIPFGAILFQLYPRKRVLIIPVVFSIMIEGAQFFTGMGICELDDVISNGLGGMIGFCAAKTIKMIAPQNIRFFRLRPKNL